MVAGMLMPLHELKAIYEVLFRDGVMVAKKDKRPQIKHPEVRDVTNLQVIRAMGSLKSRGYVRETFAWRHFYWYLTNDGIVYLRDYLHLPAEIIPASLQRVRKSAATLAIAHRAALVQSVQGPTSYVPKPGRREEAESQEALAERRGYRYKTMDPGERGNYTDRTPRFRGRPLTEEPVRPKPSLEATDQHQPLYRRGASFNSKSVKEVESTKRFTHQGPNVRNERQVVSQERRMLDAEKMNSSSAPLQTAALMQDESQASLISSSVALPLSVAVGAAPSKMAVSSSAAQKSVKIKNVTKQEISSLKFTEEISPSSSDLPSGDAKEDKTKPAEVTAPEMPMPKPVLTTESTHETSKVFSGSVASGKIRPVDADPKMHKKEEVIDESVKATEKKTQPLVKPEVGGNIKEKTAKVNKKTTKTNKANQTSSPLWTTDEADGISNITVTQEPVQAEVSSPVLPAKPDTQAFPPKMTTAPASASQEKQEDPQLIQKNYTATEMIIKQEETNVTEMPQAKKDETVSPREASRVLGQDLEVQQVIHSSLSTQKDAATEEGKYAKQAGEGTPKSKKKKKKSPGEISKITVEQDQPQLKANEKMSENDSQEVKVETFHQKTVITSELLTVSTSVKTEGEAKTDSDRKKTGNQLKKETFTKAKMKPDEVPPAAAPAAVQAKDKTEEITVTATTQEQMSPKLQAAAPDTDPEKSQEITVSNVETVTVQNVSQVELMRESAKPEKKIPADQSDSEKVTAEATSLQSTEKVADKQSKGKKKGKKQVKVSQEEETINTKSVPATEGETLSSITTLPMAAGRDSPAVAFEMTRTKVSSKMTLERMCSEEVGQAAAVLSEAPTDKGEVELTQPSAEKTKRVVPKAKTSSSARKAPAPEDLASAEAQASPLSRQEEPPRVAQHSARQAAECSTQERLSVSEASEHEEDKKRDLSEDTPSATATPAAQPDQPHLGDTSESNSADTDEANMRKKIVVVEEIVEVKQIVSPQATGQQSPPPPVKTAEEEEDEELDLDVLEEIAIERALLAGAARVKVQGASPDSDWDHSLAEPEDKTWPNFIEGLFECMSTDLLPALS